MIARYNRAIEKLPALLDIPANQGRCIYGDTMRSLLPYQEISVQTRLTTDQAAHRLSTVVSRKQFRYISADCDQYEGNVSPEGFTINRIMGYQNGFRPVLQGCFCEKNGKTHIVVKMTLPPMVLLISAIYFTVLALAVLESLSGDFIFPGLLFLAGYGVMISSFRNAADEATAFIHELFTGRIV